MRSVLLACLALVLFVATACGGDFDSETGATADYAADSIESAARYDSDDTAGYADDGESSSEVSAALDEVGFAQGGSSGGAGLAQLPDLGRDIIFTATIELASSNIAEATREAIRVVEAKGGFLFAQDTYGGAGGYSTLTFKVLPAQFHDVLADLGSVGDVRAQSVSAEDVSAIVVDLESRINTAEASVARLRNLLEDASELETIATLENQLLQRETTLEQLRGQLRSVRDQVDLATITVTLTQLTNQAAVSLDATVYAGHNGGFDCFDGARVRSAEAGDALTVCYRVTNTGDTTLGDITLNDDELGASASNVLVVDGSLLRLEPGASTMLAHEILLTDSVRLRTSATAVVLDDDANATDQQVTSTSPSMRLDLVGGRDLPAFGEVLSQSWNALVTAALVIALAAVAMAPFLLAAAVIGWPVFMWVRRRRLALLDEPVASEPAAPSVEHARTKTDPATKNETATENETAVAASTSD